MRIFCEGVQKELLTEKQKQRSFNFSLLTFKVEDGQRKKWDVGGLTV